MRKELPIGVSDYRELEEEYFSVDKSQAKKQSDVNRKI